MVARSTPEDGDIVIREVRRDGASVFVLHAAPGPDQFVVYTRAAAITQAVSVAKHESVRAWLMDGEHDFQLLENFRRDEEMV